MFFIYGALILVFIILTTSEFCKGVKDRYLIRASIGVITLGVLLQIIFETVFP